MGVIAILDAKGSKDCKGLLLALATACNDGQTIELTSVTKSLSITPGSERDRYVLKRNTFVLEELNDGVRVAVHVLEVLNLD